MSQLLDTCCSNNKESVIDYFRIIVDLHSFNLSVKDIAVRAFTTEENIHLWKLGEIEPDSRSSCVLESLWMYITNKTESELPRYKKYPIKWARS